MKMLRVLLISILITMTVAGDGVCPDGMRCNGECCRRFPNIEPHYWCCKGIFHCREAAGYGFCFLYSESKNASQLDISTSDEQANDHSSKSTSVELKSYKRLRPKDMEFAGASLAAVMEEKVQNANEFQQRIEAATKEIA